MLVREVGTVCYVARIAGFGKHGFGSCVNREPDTCVALWPRGPLYAYFGYNMVARADYDYYGGCHGATTS